jgi:nucleotide-binding universal stress UspA family protein
MAKRILVPLDRTTDHEAILQFVADTARGAGATVRLLHVAPVPDMVVNSEGLVIAYVDQETLRLETEWLDTVQAMEPLLSGVPVEPVIRFGDPVEEILTEADSFDADLSVVMTTCRSGVKRSLLGSVAEEIVRRAKPSVALIRAGSSAVDSARKGDE